MKSRKGLTTSDMPQLAMTLIFIGVVLGVGVWVTQSVQTSSGFHQDSATGVDLVVAANNTRVYFAPNVVKIDGLYNATYALTATNYSLYNDHEILITFDASQDDSATYKINYTAYNDTGYAALSNTTSSLSVVASWLPVMAVILAAAIVVGLVVVWFRD